MLIAGFSLVNWLSKIYDGTQIKGCYKPVTIISMCVSDPDITGIQKPGSGIQRRHLRYLPPYGSRNGWIPGKESGIHEGMGPGKYLPWVTAMWRLQQKCKSVLNNSKKKMTVATQTDLWHCLWYAALAVTFLSYLLSCHYRIWHHVVSFHPLCSIVTTWRGWWVSVCPSCSLRPSWRTPRWGATPSWPTPWACSSRRPTSSETIWRTRKRDVPSGHKRWDWECVLLSYYECVCFTRVT